MSSITKIYGCERGCMHEYEAYSTDWKCPHNYEVKYRCDECWGTYNDEEDAEECSVCRQEVEESPVEVPHFHQPSVPIPQRAQYKGIVLGYATPQLREK